LQQRFYFLLDSIFIVVELRSISVQKSLEMIEVWDVKEYRCHTHRHGVQPDLWCAPDARTFGACSRSSISEKGAAKTERKPPSAVFERLGETLGC
jgi:hypothetical protein